MTAHPWWMWISKILLPIRGSWRTRISGISAHNRGSPIDESLFHHSLGKRSSLRGPLRRRLHGLDRRRLVLGHRRLYPYLYPFRDPDLWALFHLLLAYT